jgi:hypothetical protein
MTGEKPPGRSRRRLLEVVPSGTLSPDGKRISDERTWD